jgi:ABC-2 type transport system permease protein
VSVLRLLAVGFWMQLKLRQTSVFDSVLSIIWPLFFATSIFLVYRQQADQAVLLSAAIGSSVMGVWTAATTTAAGSLQSERYQGTLELLVLSPRSFALTLVPLTLSMATIGLYALVATMLWLRFVLGVPLAIQDPVGFGIAGLATALATAAMGYVLALSTVRYRSAWAVGAAVELPVWLICGFIVPLGQLPAWVADIARFLPITWAVEAVHAAALGRPIWLDLLMTALLVAVFYVAGALLSRRLLTSARVHAALALT